MTMTPNSVSELLELNQKRQEQEREVSPEQVKELIGKLNYSDTLDIMKRLLFGIMVYHKQQVETLTQEGEDTGCVLAWHHDAVQLHNAFQLVRHIDEQED